VNAAHSKELQSLEISSQGASIPKIVHYKFSDHLTNIEGIEQLLDWIDYGSEGWGFESL
jgi:hypothetical protein